MLVTGGVGFIGSHLVDRLANIVEEVVVFDNLSSGNLDNLENVRNARSFRLSRGDLLDFDRKVLDDCSIVFHLAANPEVRIGATDPSVDFEQNIVVTRNLLEAMRLSRCAKTIVFASTSTVYGEAEILPTPENYGPMMPISMYGASKLGCEALISAYCNLFDMRAVMYRFANVVGSRSRHGVIYDFIQKLSKDPRELEILGDGTQSKSYLLVDDCVEAFLFGLEHAKNHVEIFNVGSMGKVNVKMIARAVLEEMKLADVKLRFTGGVDGRGWPGDVKEMLLDIQKIKSLGWSPRHDGVESVKLAVQALVRELLSGA